MSNVVYNALKVGLINGDINLGSDTLKIALVASAYVPDIDAHTAYDDVTNEMPATGGYTTGGQTLSGVTVLTDLANDRAALDADDVTWTTSTITAARGAVIYKDTGTPATSTLICYIDFATDKSSSGGDFTIAWDATGILRLA
jgi:hypothetical protein